MPRPRIHSIDLLRGLVMIIMALDHTRDFFHETAMTADPLNPATTTVPLFFTRWITHFCAPVFVFLSGLSVYLSAQQKPAGQVNTFLRKRGLWLIVAEVLLVNLGLTFNPFYNFILLLVIWAIGCSLILLSLVRNSYRTVVMLGLLLVLGHNITDHITPPTAVVPATVLKILVTAFGTVIPLGERHLLGFFYAVLPWTGILFLGYAAGPWFAAGFDAAKRRRNLLRSGVGALLLFILLRTINVYGDPSPHRDYGAALPNFLSFLNVSKYPPSLQFTCLMLGPALLFLAVAERFGGRIAAVIRTYGRVPFFYYVLHFYLLHALLVIAFFASGHGVGEIAVFPMPIWFRPVQFGYGLPGVYAIWFCVVTVFYWPCRWFWQYKQTHDYWWLRYL